MNPKVREYSTARIGAGLRLDAWKGYMQEVYYGLDVKSHGERAVRGKLSGSQLGQVGVSRLKTRDAHRVVRGKGQAEADRDENFVVCLPERGAITYTQREQKCVVLPGEAGILNSAESYDSEVEDESSHLTIKLPHSMIRSRLPAIDGLCAGLTIRNPAVVRLLHGFASNFLRLNGPDASSKLGEICADMVIVMIDSSNIAVAGGAPSKMLSEAIFDNLTNSLKTHFRDPEFDIEQAAVAANVSVRYVHKLFQTHETTFGTALIEARLREADRLLRLNMNEKVPIGLIAYQCGFVNQAHFASRYRQRFGVAPRDARSSRATMALHDVTRIGIE